MVLKLSIAVDTMGGDFGPRITVPACLEALALHPTLHIYLIGQSSLIDPLLVNSSVSLERLTVIDCQDSVSMDDKPSYALRHRQHSSMAKALQMVNEGVVSACVSAGNTGALMALARKTLGMLPGVDRPAIISAVPTSEGCCYLLDLGANVDCSAEHLLQFALMGSGMVNAVEGIERPRVALLNIGTETYKGNEQVRLAAERLKVQPQLNYIGFIEADSVFEHRADVIVCDGFTGNIALKSSEGLARFIASKLRINFSQNIYRRMLGWLARPVLKELQQQIDPGRRNGAAFLGLQGIVIKSHGGANQDHFVCAISQAVTDIHNDVPGRIRDTIASQLGQLSRE